MSKCDVVSSSLCRGQRVLSFLLFLLYFTVLFPTVSSARHTSLEEGLWRVWEQWWAGGVVAMAVKAAAQL